MEGGGGVEAAEAPGRTSLLGGHVQHQIANTVAVAELVVVPADKQKG